MSKKSLKGRNNNLAKAEHQLEILSSGIFANGELPTFAEKIKETHQLPIRPQKLEILQLNLGYMCNQVCAHCHVDAGPDRKEIMTKHTMQQCLEVIQKTNAHTLTMRTVMVNTNMVGPCSFDLTGFPKRVLRYPW